MKKIYTGFLVLLSLVLILNFIFASHTVTTSTGATSYNINEDTVYVFNVTINNTDVGSSANITQVNVTLPSGFSFTADSNGTNALNSQIVFSNTSSVLTWKNTTYHVINGSVNNTHFWFNISAATPGDYNITVTTLNTTGLYYFNSNISIHVNDTTRPSVIITNPAANGTNYSTSSFNFSLRLSDNINISSCWFTLTSGVNNYTMTVNASKTGANYTNESIADGTYTSKFYCNDTSNNLNGTELTTLTIDTALPVITLLSPADNAGNQNPSFNVSFNVTDNSLINCSLVLNGAIVNNLLSAVNGTNSFVNLSYITTNTWNINCTDNVNNKANSSIRTFTLTSFQFNGTVKDEPGNAINNSLVNITIRNQNTWGIVGYVSTTSNASGWFNITLASNSSWLYSPSMIQRNSTYNHVDYVSKTIPPFPSVMMSFLAGTNFYLTEAGTINLTAINITGFNNRTTFQYEIKDTKLGFPIVSDHSNFASDVVVFVPKNRNYSIMIYPNQNMPVSFEWTNFSATSSYNLSTGGSLFLSNYNVTTKTLNKQFNISSSQVRVYGFANVSSTSTPTINFTNLTVIPFLVESGNMVHATYGDLPWNLSTAWGDTDNYNTTGYYNITLAGTAETSRVLLFATAVGNDSKRYGGFRNMTPGYGMAPQSINFTMYELLGNSTTMLLNDLTGGTFSAPMNVMNFTIVNASNSSLGSIAAHVELTVNYTNYGAFSFTWMTDVAQSSAVASFAIPMINATGFEEMNVFVNGGPSGGNGQYAPIKLTKRTVAQIQSNPNITVRTFNPQALDGTIGANISIGLYISNSSCDRPNPTAGCSLTGGDSDDMASFNPMGAVMGGGKISFRMGIGGVLVHYVHVDLMASGPPDALFEDNNDVSEGTSGGFSKAMRFGSAGPTIYDYVLVSLPYTEGSSTTTGLQENNDINLSIPTFYGENTDGSMNWNTPIWSSSNGTNATALAGNYSHYSAFKDDWQRLMSVNNCTKTETSLSASTPCFVDLANNRIWVRLPHFSGTTPNVAGSVTSVSSTTTSSSSGGTGITATWKSTKIITENEFKTGAVRELGAKERVRVTVEKSAHYVGVKALTSTTATIEVSSTPQQATFSVGEEKKFDVNSDSIYDIYVKLNSINNNKASVTIRSISEKISAPIVEAPKQEEKKKESALPETSRETTTETLKETKSLTWLWMVIIAIIVLLIAIVILSLAKGKKKSNVVLKKGRYY